MHRLYLRHTAAKVGREGSDRWCGGLFNSFLGQWVSQGGA